MEKKKIIFQKCNFNYIYFLLYILVYVVSKILESIVDIKDFEKENSNTKDNHFFLSFRLLIKYFSNISDFFAIIPYLIRKKLLKKSNVSSKKIETLEIDEEDSELKEKNQLIYNDIGLAEAQKRKKLIIIFCALVGIFDFLRDFTEILNYIILDTQDFYLNPFSFTVIFDIVLQFACSYLLLKGNFYKLQFFSLFLNFGIFVIILIIDIYKFLVKKKTFAPHLFILFPCYLIFYCLKDIYGKKVILYGYISLYLLMIIKGLFKLILFIIFSIILLIVKRDYFEAIPFFFTHKKYIILLILNTITEFFMNIFLWIIIDRFSPNHNPLALLLEELTDFIFFVIKPRNQEENTNKSIEWDIYVRVFLYIISFIGVLIHNEIIVINICGLGSDTKYFLDLEVIKEEDYMYADNPNDLRKFETVAEMEEQINDNISNEDEKIINN